MSLAIKALAHSVLDFAAEHLHFKLQKHRLQKTAEPLLEPKPTKKRRTITRDYARLTDGQIIALVRMYQKVQKHNNNPDRTKKIITQQDIADWANEKFGVNKSRKTYMKIIREYLEKNSNDNV